jgi:hypothetical protein
MYSEVGDSMGEILFLAVFAVSAQAAVSPGLQTGLNIGSQIGNAAAQVALPSARQNTAASAQTSFVDTTFRNSVSACVAKKSKGLSALKQVKCTKPDEALLNELDGKECENYENEGASNQVETSKSGTQFTLNKSAIKTDKDALKKFKSSLESYGKCSKDETRAEFLPAQQKLDLLSCQKDAQSAVTEAINNAMAPMIQRNQADYDAKTQVLQAMDGVRGQAAMLLGIDDKGEPVAGAGLGISGAIKLQRDRLKELTATKSQLVAKVQQANLLTRKASQGLEQRIAKRLLNCMQTTPIAVRDKKGKLTTTMCRQEGSAAGGVYGKAGMRPCGFLEYATQVSASNSLSANGTQAINARSRAAADTAEKNAKNVQCEIAARLGITEGMDSCPEGLRAQSAGGAGASTVSGVDQNASVILEYSKRFDPSLKAVYDKTVAVCQKAAQDTRSFETDPEKNSQYQVDLGESKVALNSAALEIGQTIEMERTLYNESLKAFPFPPEVIDPNLDPSCTGSDLMKRMSCIDTFQKQNQNLLAGTGSRRFPLKIKSTNGSVKGLDAFCTGLEPCEKMLLDYSKNIVKQQGEVAQARNVSVIAGNNAIQQQMTQAAAAVSRLHQEKIKSTANELTPLLKGLDISEILELSPVEKADGSGSEDGDKGPMPVKPDALQTALAASGGVLDLDRLDLAAINTAMNEKIKEKNEETDTKIEEWTTKVADIEKVLAGISNKADKNKTCGGEVVGSGGSDDYDPVVRQPCEGMEIEKACIDRFKAKIKDETTISLTSRLSAVIELLKGHTYADCQDDDLTQALSCLAEVDDKKNQNVSDGLRALNRAEKFE